MDRNEILTRYCFIMDMIKLRLNNINRIINPSAYTNPSDWAMAVESSYLHVRKICEFVAIGCLAVHGDIAGTRSKSLRKQWHANEILQKMEKLYADFFPIAVTQIVDAENKTIGYSIGKEGVITKADLIATYKHCGDVLHAGCLRDVEEMKPWAADALYLIKMSNGIAKLLEIHRIDTIQPDHYVSGVLASRQRNGATVATLIKGSVHDTGPL